MSDQPAPSASSACVTRAAPQSSSRLWRWIVPTFGKKGWKHRLRWVVLRIAGYYLLIVAGIGFFQRKLIYLPRRADSIPARAAGFSPGQIHDVSFTSHDGLVLHGWHVVPRDPACKTEADCDALLKDPRRIVLYFPGNGDNRSRRAAELHCLAALGAHVVLFDYRGYGENPGSPGEEHLARDARSAWEFVIRDLGVPPERIVFYGESLGGAVATRLAGELCQAKTPPAGLVVSGTFSSLADTGAGHYPWLPVRLLLIDRFPSIDRIAAVTCPVLHLHGDQDEIVPIPLGKKLFAAAPEKSASGIPKQFIEITGGGHNDFSDSTLQPPLREFLARIEAPGAE